MYVHLFWVLDWSRLLFHCPCGKWFLPKCHLLHCNNRAIIPPVIMLTFPDSFSCLLCKSQCTGTKQSAQSATPGWYTCISCWAPAKRIQSETCWNLIQIKANVLVAKFLISADGIRSKISLRIYLTVGSVAKEGSRLVPRCIHLTIFLEFEIICCSLLVLPPLASDCGYTVHLKQHKANIPSGVSFLLKTSKPARKWW